MAHFYGTAHGNRGQASRLGTKDSGMSVSGSGWHVGGEIRCEHNSVHDLDMVRLTLTSGSNGTRIGAIDAQCKSGGGPLTVTSLDIELLKLVDDKVWHSLCQDKWFIQKMKAILFLNMDKLP